MSHNNLTMPLFLESEDANFTVDELIERDFLQSLPSDKRPTPASDPQDTARRVREALTETTLFTEEEITNVSAHFEKSTSFDICAEKVVRSHGFPSY